MPSILSLHGEGRDFLEFRTDSQELSPLLLRWLPSGTEAPQLLLADRNPLGNLSDNGWKLVPRDSAQEVAQTWGEGRDTDSSPIQRLPRVCLEESRFQAVAFGRGEISFLLASISNNTVSEL